MIRQVSSDDVLVPAHCEHPDTYKDNFLRATFGTGNLMLFAGDQKIEHLNADFVGESVAADDAHPEHLFRIAQQADVGVFAAQHGIVSRYAHKYPQVRYLVKMNSKTNLVPTEQQDPLSTQLTDFEDVLALRDKAVDVVGVGYTVYLGSEYEHVMLAEAARLISQAHRHGLLAVLWMYPRGKAVEDETSPDIVAGATGVACSLGADFVKVSPPRTDQGMLPEYLRQAVDAAGATGVITSGGHSTDAQDFLARTYEQLHEAGIRGSATGRNIHQRPLADAVAMARALKDVVIRGESLEDATRRFKNAE